jgi:glucokinase
MGLYALKPVGGRHDTMKRYAVGMDVGGTKIAAGLVDRGGRILHRFTSRTHSEHEPEFVIQAITQAYRALINGGGVNSADIEAIGLGFPGNINGAEGIVLGCSNLPSWDHIPLRDTVVARINMPVVLENDANLCALGEHRYGAGRGTRNMCYVTLSTGFGMGIIVEKQLYTGHTGMAGELGHIVLEPDGPLCGCGQHGCLMAFASGIGLSRMAYARLEEGAETILREKMPTAGRRFSGEVIAEAARHGDRVAREIIRAAGIHAGIGLSIAIQVLNPEMIVIGGGLTQIGLLLEEPMLATMWQRTQPELRDTVAIRRWELGDDLGILGAAAKVFADAEHHQAQRESRQ